MGPASTYRATTTIFAVLDSHLRGNPWTLYICVPVELFLSPPWQGGRRAFCGRGSGHRLRPPVVSLRKGANWNGQTKGLASGN